MRNLEMTQAAVGKPANPSPHRPSGHAAQFATARRVRRGEWCGQAMSIDCTAMPNVDQAPYRPHCRARPLYRFERVCAEPPAGSPSSTPRGRNSLGPRPDQSPQCRPVRAGLQFDISGVSAVRLAAALAVAMIAPEPESRMALVPSRGVTFRPRAAGRRGYA